MGSMPCNPRQEIAIAMGRYACLMHRLLFFFRIDRLQGL
jgi:hypothetical protein